MSFGQPLWFWAFALLPFLLVFFVRHERRRVKLLRQLVAARLLDRLAGSVSLGRRRLRFAILLLGLSALILSLAQPRYGYTWEESKRKGRDIIIAIDCSKSMLATDVSPSRLERAKMAVQDLVGQLQGDRVGLIAFAGTAFLQAPLTIDYGAVLNSLSAFDTNIIPRGGTNIAGAITEADAAFGKGESDNRCLILFTDGEELEDDAVAAATAEKDHMKIFTVGVGSADGSLIPIPDEHGGTTFAKDESGQFVKSRLDEDRLRKIAESAGGFYVHLQNGPAEMQHIVRDGLGQMKEQEIDTRMSRRPIERYEWPLTAALILLVAATLIGERKTAPRAKRLPAAAILLLLILPVVAHAKNDGLEAYDREDYKGAITEFDRQLQQQRDSAALNFDLGAAAYKSGDYPKALDAFSKATTSPDPALHSAAEYNLGNTLFEQGVRLEQKDRKIRELKDALTHYEQALKVAPQNKDAQYNRDVVRRLLEELQKPPPKSDQKQQQKQQDKKDDQQDQKNQQNQQQQQSKGGKSNQDQQQQSQSQQQQQQNQQQQQSQSQQSQSQSQQAQNQQSQQSQGGGQSQQQQSQGQQPKDQQQQGSQQQKQQASNKPEGKEGQQNPQPDQKNGNEGQKQQADQSRGGQQSPQQQADNGQGQPLKPMPDESGKKREGQIQAQASAQPGNSQKEEAAEAEAAKEGKMTAAQAKSLLESLRDEDEHVQLLKPPGKPRGQNFRDW